MNRPTSLFLNHKRNHCPTFLLSSEEEFIDINEINIPSIPFISFSDYNFDFQFSSKNNLISKRQTIINTSPQRIQNENLMSKNNQSITNINSLDAISLDSLTQRFPHRKINIILDIDHTLIYSKNMDKFNYLNKHLIRRGDSNCYDFYEMPKEEVLEVPKNGSTIICHTSTICE